MNSDRGSYLLGAAVAAVLAATLFALTAHYTSLSLARQALAAASQRVLRCLTTTDGGCTSPTNSDERRVEWFLQPSAPRTLRWQDRSRITGRVVEQQWELRGASRELLMTPVPPLVWSGSTLPLYSLRGRLNRFERRVARVDLRALIDTESQEQRLRPTFEPNFPTFDEGFERRVDRLRFDAWYPLVLGVQRELTPAPFRFTFMDSVPHAIAPASTVTISSPVVKVPILPLHLDCTTSADAPCTAATGSHDIHRYASIAIKAFAEITNSSGGEVRWGDFARGAGLEVTVWSAADVERALSNNTPLPDRAATCLGGRDWVRLSHGHTEQVHLWLRGPLGAHGGQSALCPEARATHSPIEVERGGAFQIRARLSARGGPVSASVRLAHFIESFTPIEFTVRNTIPHRCEQEIRLKRGEPLPECPVAALCPLLPGSRITSCTVSVQHIPGCWDNGDSDAELFSAGEESCEAELLRASCSGLPPEDAAPPCRLPPDRMLCGWESTPTDKRLITPTPTQRCTAANPYAHTLPCTHSNALRVFRPDGDYGEVSSCKEVVSQLARLNAEAARLEKEHGLSLARLDLGALHWDNDAAARAATWVAADGVNSDSEAPAGSQRVITHAFPLHTPLLRRIDRSYLPPPSLFTVPNTLSKQSAGFTPVLLSERTVLLPSILSEPVYDSTLCAASESELQGKLRTLAAATLPALSDSSIYFEGTAEHFDSIVESVQGGCGKPPPTTTAPRCNGEHITNLEPEQCGPPTSLGVFPYTLFPAGPPQCQAPHVSCYAKPLPTNESQSALQLDWDRIHNTALTELRRALGDSLDRCKECLRIEVERRNWPEVTVTATLHYASPSTLNRFFTTDTVHLAVRAQGRHELGTHSRAQGDGQ